MISLLAQTGQAPQGGGLPWPAIFKIAIFVLFILFSVLGSVMKKYAEDKKKKEIERKRLRQQDELMRTGRIEAPEKLPGTQLSTSPTPPIMQPTMGGMSPGDEAKRRLQELAERRRRELAEMARQQGASRPASAGSPQPPMAPPTRQAQPPQRQQPQQPQRSTVHSRQATPEQQIRQKREAAAREKAARDSALRKKAEEQEARRERELAARERAEREAQRREADEVPHLGHAAAAPGQAVASAVSRLDASPRPTPGSPADWRKAIIMAELLNRPIALRDADEKVI